MQELTYEQFILSLRSALHYLYDPVQLRNSPLVEYFGLGAEFDKAAALQQRLTAAIRALTPAEDDPPQSRAWRVYDILNFQYLRQLSRDAVATQLGISERQLRREQRVALEVLAQSLWPQLQWPATTPAATSAVAADAEQALSEELGWLKQPVAEEYVPLVVALQTVQNLAQPLARQWQVALQVNVPPVLANFPVTPLALRSILLTMLSVAIPRAGRGSVVIAAIGTNMTLALTVTSGDPTLVQPPFTAKDWASLQTAQNIASFYSADLVIPPTPDAGFVGTLTLRTPEQLPVLVIDDNTDWIELQQRYAAGSRYQVIGCHEPANARHLAEKVQPAVILLDVMMHNVDGWQVLSELRQEPATAAIPIVICTILPVGELALSLGATAFLQKPITQQQFLQLLDQQLQQQRTLLGTQRGS
ncbi:MAG: response regulator [Caldilineaceae bacterium]|nr:response regulator [Caldilineaceae bacterium]